METLLQILNELHPDVDFTAENALIDDGVLDSLDIVTLITEINDKFDVEIPAEEILPENFNSATALYALILYVFCLPAVVEEFAATGRWLLAATIAMGVALFFVYDVLLGRLMARWPAKV